MGGPVRSQPGVDPRRGKLMCVKVRLLDDTIAVFHLGHKATGQMLLDEVSRHLNLLESDYFGLEFVDNEGCHVWLDMEKQILRQIAGTDDVKFHLIVKFYTPNPMDLEEEYTRYLLSLQIRRDLSQGHFLSAESTAALLAAYFVQSDCGDFSAEDYPDASYLSHTRFVPNQTIHFQQKVMECHKKLIGLTPEDADMQMLEVARRCDFYGIKLHPARDIEGTEACLAVMHLGIKVFHQFHCVSTFSWAKIRKLSFKRKKLLIKLHPDSYQCYKETIEFYFDSRNECKNFWKKCVEHHGFFRCIQVEMPKKDNRLFSKGSSFRYHGRTQKQLIDYVREHHKRREPFTRPLRSGYHTCGLGSSATSAISSTNRNARDRSHTSAPTVATVRPQHQATAADPEERSSKRKSIIYGVNSTFSDASVDSSDNLKGILSSTSSRGASSDYGAISMNGAELNASSNYGNELNNSIKKEAKPNGYGTIFRRLASSSCTSKTNSQTNLEKESDYDALDKLLNTNNSSLLFDAEGFDVDGEYSESFALKKIKEDLRVHERALLRDALLISKVFRQRVQKVTKDYYLLEDMFNQVDQIATSISKFIRDLDSFPEAVHDLGEKLSHFILTSSGPAVTKQDNFLRNLPSYVTALCELRNSCPEFRTLFNEFENSLECYLPVTWFLIRVLNRLSHWQESCTRIVEVLLSSGLGSEALGTARLAVDTLAHFTITNLEKKKALYDYCMLLEIEKAISGIQLIAYPERHIVRIGRIDDESKESLSCLLILFNDCLLFVKPTENSFDVLKIIHFSQVIQAKLHTEGPKPIILLNTKVELVEFSGKHIGNWIDDIIDQVNQYRKNPPKLSCISSKLLQSNSQDKANMAICAPFLGLCYELNCTFSRNEYHQIIERWRAGVLLRSLRTSSGWQRLFILHTHGHLFFFNSHKDAAPLASMCLFDYNVSVPTLQDNVKPKNVFKITKAPFIYFFQASSHYAFLRWIESLRSSCSSKNPLDALTVLSVHL